MIVRKATINSVAAFDAAPEGEWFCASNGLGIEIAFDEFSWEKDRLTIQLPRRILRKFKAKRGRPLKARISGDQLIVER